MCIAHIGFRLECYNCGNETFHETFISTAEGRQRPTLRQVWTYLDYPRCPEPCRRIDRYEYHRVMDCDCYDKYVEWNYPGVPSTAGDDEGSRSWPMLCHTCDDLDIEINMDIQDDPRESDNTDVRPPQHVEQIRKAPHPDDLTFHRFEDDSDNADDEGMERYNQRRVLVPGLSSIRIRRPGNASRRDFRHRSDDGDDRTEYYEDQSRRSETDDDDYTNTQGSESRRDAESMHSFTADQSSDVGPRQARYSNRGRQYSVSPVQDAPTPARRGGHYEDDDRAYQDAESMHSYAHSEADTRPRPYTDSGHNNSTSTLQGPPTPARRGGRYEDETDDGYSRTEQDNESIRSGYTTDRHDNPSYASTTCSNDLPIPYSSGSRRKPPPLPVRRNFSHPDYHSPRAPPPPPSERSESEDESEEGNRGRSRGGGGSRSRSPPRSRSLRRSPPQTRPRSPSGPYDDDELDLAHPYDCDCEYCDPRGRSRYRRDDGR